MSHIDRCVLFYYSLLDYYYWLFMWKQHFIMWMIQFIYFICLIYSNKSHFMSILFQNVTSNFNCKINVESVYISLWSVAQYQVCRWDSTSCQHLPTICFCYDHFMSFKMSVWISMSSGWILILSAVLQADFMVPVWACYFLLNDHIYGCKPNQHRLMLLRESRHLWAAW